MNSHLLHWLIDLSNMVLLEVLPITFLFSKRCYLINVLIIKYDINCTVRYYNYHLPIIYVSKNYKYMQKI